MLPFGDEAKAVTEGTVPDPLLLTSPVSVWGHHVFLMSDNCIILASVLRVGSLLSAPHVKARSVASAG